MTVRRPNRALRLVVIVALAVVAAACIPAPVVEPPAPPPPPAGPVPALDADNPDARNPFGWMEGGREWRGDFPDPHILRDGDTYFA